jgi:hypothetical protein
MKVGCPTHETLTRPSATLSQGERDCVAYITAK